MGLFYYRNLIQKITTQILNCTNFYQERNCRYYYNVEKGTILEPYDKKILANLSENCNIYCKLVLLLKLDTQAYYNMRIILGLDVNNYLGVTNLPEYVLSSL